MDVLNLISMINHFILFINDEQRFRARMSVSLYFLEYFTIFYNITVSN